MGVSKRLRYEVLRRDNHACRYCGRSAPDVPLTVDHVVPVALGGSDKADNLVAACKDCNAGKSASSPDAPIVDQVREDALRWGQAMDIVYIQATLDRTVRDCRRRQFEEAWKSWTYEFRGDRRTFSLPADWHESIDRFHGLGLHEDDLRDAIESTMPRYGVNDRFRYFCGLCWNMITDRQELARAYLAAKGDPDGA